MDDRPSHGDGSAFAQYVALFPRLSQALLYAERCLLLDALPTAAQEYKATGRATPEFWDWCRRRRIRSRKRHRAERRAKRRINGHQHS